MTQSTIPSPFTHKPRRVLRRAIAVLLAPALTMLLAPAAFSAVTYLDAAGGSAGNTFATGSTASDTSWYTTTLPASGTTNESQWVVRSGFTPPTNGDDAFQASHTTNDANGDTMPELTTRITGLTPGATYNIYAFFWDSTNADQDWTLQAGLATGSYTNFSHDVNPNMTTTIAPAASTLSYTSSVSTSANSGNLLMYAAGLGPVVADGSGEIDVFLHSIGYNGSNAPGTGIGAAAGANDVRSWYDGVGYEQVVSSSVPTPAALPGGLLLLAGAMTRRRRRAL